MPGIGRLGGWRAHPGRHRTRTSPPISVRVRDAATEPRSLFPTRDPAKSVRLMAALDAVNARFGRGALRPLSTGLARPWGTRQARLSPRYTTRVDELMEANAR